jgi:hypothetical protein
VISGPQLAAVISGPQLAKARVASQVNAGMTSDANSSAD